jgi:hypothetical protein
MVTDRIPDILGAVDEVIKLNYERYRSSLGGRQSQEVLQLGITDYNLNVTAVPPAALDPVTARAAVRKIVAGQLARSVGAASL